MFGASSIGRAFFAPFFVFMALLFLGQVVFGLFEGDAFWMVSAPTYWVQPLQTLVCGALLVHYWPSYPLRLPWHFGWATFVGVLALLIWLAPQFFFHAAPRLEGFEPAFFGAEGWPYFLNLTFRFVRLVIVVPLVEEIFWRGFLLRWVIREDFLQVPFGAFTWKSFLVVALFFMLEHQAADYPAAFITGALYNFLAIRTRSLGACVLAHAVTNLLLGLYILRTGQWGFW